DVATLNVIEHDFTDIAGNSFATEIAWLADQEITTGYKIGTEFRAKNNITREAMTAFLYRAVESDYAGLPFTPFTDVSKDHSFYNEITWAFKEGVTGGYADGTFRPKNEITREAMAAFLFRLADVDEEDLSDDHGFNDVSSFETEIAWMVDQGIT